MVVLRRTWLATALFVLASSVVWWRLLDVDAAQRHLYPTLLLSPLIWWGVVARQLKPRLWRGSVGGALAGAVTQSVQNVPDLWRLIVHRGAGNGEDQAIAIASVAVYLLIGVCATLLGALLGTVALVVQRRLDGAETA